MARVVFSDELQSLITAQRNQDQKQQRERDASEALLEALRAEPFDGERVRLACEALDEARGFYEFSILERIDAERNYRTWIERAEQAKHDERMSA